MAALTVFHLSSVLYSPPSPSSLCGVILFFLLIYISIAWISMQLFMQFSLLGKKNGPKYFPGSSLALRYLYHNDCGSGISHLVNHLLLNTCLTNITFDMSVYTLFTVILVEPLDSCRVRLSVVTVTCNVTSADALHSSAAVHSSALLIHRVLTTRRAKYGVSLVSRWGTVTVDINPVLTR